MSDRKIGGKKRLRSLRTTVSRFMVIFTAALVSYMTLLLGLNIRDYQREQRESFLQALESWRDRADVSVTAMNSQLQSIYSYNPDFTALSEAKTDAAKYTSAYQLLQTCRIAVNSNDTLAGLFVAYNQGDNCVYAVNQEISAEDLAVLRGLASAVGQTNYTSYLEKAADDSYLVLYLSRLQASVMGAVRLTDGMQASAAGKNSSAAVLLNGQMITVSGEDLPLTDSADSSASSVWRKDGSLFFLTSPGQTGIAVLERVPETMQFYLSGAHLVMMELIVSVLIVMIALTRYARRQLAVPLEDMTRALGQIQNGTWEADFQAENHISEIEDVRSAVNILLKQIEAYKIEIYEERISRQNTQLQFMRLQLAPHFYTNCLKNAYYMLLLGETDNAGQFLLKLSTHIRYLLSQNKDLVTVQEELDFVSNYIDMQKLMTEKPIKVQMITAPEVLAERIPILSVQTFVENSVKYARDRDGGELNIMIWAKRLKTDGRNYVDLTVADCGVGYPEEMLRTLNSREPESEEKGGVGIINLLTRIRFRYGKEGSWYFRNEIGAVSEIILPSSAADAGGRPGTQLENSTLREISETAAGDGKKADGLSADGQLTDGMTLDNQTVNEKTAAAKNTDDHETVGKNADKKVADDQTEDEKTSDRKAGVR